VTNIDRENLDIYKNLADIKKTFMRFLANLHDGGTIIINRDDKNCYSLKKKIDALARRKKLQIIWYSLRGPAAKKIKKAIQILGSHNVSNALAAYHFGQTLKISEKNILAAIRAYRGVERRMQHRDDVRLATGDLSIYDDYAHHPTEIETTLRAFREKFPKAKIVCVFQPHQAKRLATLFKEFQDAFNNADITLILPLYKVSGRDEETLIYTSENLVRAIHKRQPKKLIFYLNDPKKLTIALSVLLSSLKSRPSSKTKNKTILVMMGAGNIVQYTDALLKWNPTNRAQSL
jgi:UDP-N-acetylmuramate--alanine ligase